MSKLILTKNTKNILSGAWAITSSFYFLNAPIKDINGNTYVSSSIFKPNMNDTDKLTMGAQFGSGAVGYYGRRKTTSPSSTDSDKIWYDVGYEEQEPTEDTYVTDRANVSIAVSLNSDNSRLPRIYTITNNTAETITINSLSSYGVISGDATKSTSSEHYVYVLLSVVYFDDITIEPGHAASIQGFFE